MEPVTDQSYSSVDWIIKDIMDNYPSLDRVKAEQKLRKEKLELTSALLDLRVTNFKEENLGRYETELEKINVLKNRFVESVYQFLNSFGHEVCDDDRVLYRDEINDVEMKVVEHSREIRKHASDLKTLSQYRSILDNGKNKGQKLETILEMCKEIDEGNKEQQQQPGSVSQLVAFQGQQKSDKQENDEPETENKTKKKSTFSYSLKKEITETMTVTKES